MLHRAMTLLAFLWQGMVDAAPLPAYDLMTARSFSTEEQP